MNYPGRKDAVNTVCLHVDKQCRMSGLQAVKCKLYCIYDRVCNMATKCWLDDANN